MHEVAIIGAGELGGAIAHALARRDLVCAIHLVDDAAGIAAGKALDIAQSAALMGFSTRVRGTADLGSIGGAAHVIVADCAARGEWAGDAALDLLQRLPPARHRLVLCAGAGQREVVERGVRELHLPRRRLFGSAAEALAAAVRTLVASETKGSPQDVALAVLGVPPSRIVVPWEDATIGGMPATGLLDEPTRRRLARHVASLWPPGPHALAWAAVKATEAMTGASRRLVSCFVAPDDSLGQRMRAAASPVRLGPGGIESVEIPRLSAHDRVAFDNAVVL
jgi:malate dehydrogenase